MRAPETIRFQRGLQGHIIVPVTIEGVAGYAVLDNGSSTTMIDRKFAEEQSISHGPLARMLIRTIRGGFEFGQPARVAIGSVHEKVTPLVVDIGIASLAAGADLIGIVGEEVFERHVVAIDFVRNEITLYDPRSYVPTPGLVQLSLDSKYKGRPRLPGSIEGEGDREVTFDLGATRFAKIEEGKLANRMMADGRPWIPNASGVIHDGEFMRHDGRTITTKEIAFAGFVLRDVPTDIAPKDSVAPSDVLLGVEALSRFDLIFDVGGKRMWMRPNAAYDQPFPHRVVGVDVKISSAAGAVEVLSVAVNSPAERAGLRQGDIITRIDGHIAMPDALARVKEGDTVELERKDGSKVRINAARFY
jgi:hypothetical protein